MKNEKDIKKVYMSHLEKNSPDFNAMWDKIEMNISENERNQIKHTENHAITKSCRHKSFALIAACIAVVVFGRLITSSRSLESQNDSFHANQDDNSSANSGEQANSTDNSVSGNPNSAPDISTEFTNTDKVKPDFNANEAYSIAYTQLWLASAEELDVELSYDFSEYFVEEEVLAKTESIVEVFCIDSTVVSKDGSQAIEYTFEVVESFCGNISKDEIIAITSTTPYQMLRGREYIILIYDNKCPKLSYENAPQIEVTLDNNLVYHNGFSSLDINSLYLQYPQNSENDYFYDRMRLQQNKDLSDMLELWSSLSG